MKNTIQLVGYYGSDETHGLSAWTSTGQIFLDEIEDKTGEPRRNRIPKMLDDLASAGHHTPFEKSALHFLMTVEQASHIHLLKHRIGVSINGESARYKELKDKYYIPGDWDEDLQSMLNNHCLESFRLYHRTLDSLIARGVSRKRAKESARFFLPYASQIQLDVMFNWRSFHHFLGLRKKANAQDEIHEIAKTCLELVKAIQGNPFKNTIAAFKY